MTQEEIDLLLSKVGDKSKKEVEVQMDALKSAGAIVDRKTVEDLIAKSKPEDNKGEIDLIKKEMETQANKIKALTENPTPANKEVRSFKDAFFKAFDSLGEQGKNLLKSKERWDEKKINLEVKAVNITDATTIGAGSTQYTLTDNTGIISPIRQRAEKYLSGASVGNASGNALMWIEETTESGTVIPIAEAGTKTQTSVLYVEKTTPIRKVAVSAKLSTEFLADLPQLYSYVTTNLAKRVGIAVENGLLLGDGSGITLYGLNSFATTFSAGTAALQIATPNYIDVIQAANKQCVLAYGIPNRWYIHPDDMLVLKSAKTSYGEPLWKDYMNTTGDVVIGGALLVETPAMTAGSFVGGDCTVANVRFRESLNIQLGESGDDFINNLKTIVIEQRLGQFVSANDATVIVKGDWATAVTALTKP